MGKSFITLGAKSLWGNPFINLSRISTVMWGDLKRKDFPNSKVWIHHRTAFTQ